MESNRRRRGFMKGKLMPLYRSAKSSSNFEYSSSNVKPSQSSPSPASVGYVVRQDYMVQAPPTQKVSFIFPDNNNNSDNTTNFINNSNSISNREKLAQFDKLFGVIGDENVDIKSASYISSVQERFKLERMNSERVRREEMVMQQN